MNRASQAICAVLAVVLTGCLVSDVFAEANTGTNITTGRTVASYVEGKYGFVTLSGTVSKVLDHDRFELDYGNGLTQIDCDDALHESI